MMRYPSVGTVLVKRRTSGKTLCRGLLVTIAVILLLEDLYLVVVTSNKDESSQSQELDFAETANRGRNVKSIMSEEKAEPPRQARAIRNVLPNRDAYLSLLGQVNDSSVLTKLPERPYDARAVKKIRQDVERETNIKKYLIASKGNMPLGSTLQFFEGRNKSTFYVVPELYNELPDKDNTKLKWPAVPHQRCSVVGNGGILLDSGCGPSIDAANVVLRSNMPPLTLESSLEGAANPPRPVDYYKDVGKKTTFVTLNPSGIIEYLRGLSNEVYVINFRSYMDQYEDAIAWTHVFHYQSKAKPALQFIRVSRALGFKSTVVSSHAKFLEGVNAFWRKRGLTGERATSGLVLTALSLVLCKETHLYGYWPFPVDYEGREVPYHYYTYDAEHKQNNTFHKLPEEFKILQGLHKKGILKLHVGQCEGN